MPAIYGSGAATTAMGIQPNPIGTPQEIRNLRLDLRAVGSCAPPSPGVRGCQAYQRCIFRFTKFGGFRDQGPKNVGYFLETHEGNKIERYAPCWFFMSRLFDRMRAGERDRQDGKRGEIVQIVAQEGEIIHQQTTVNQNEGSPPNVQPIWKKQMESIEVPAFPRPSERSALSYDALLDERRRQRESDDPDMQEGPIHRVDPDEEMEEEYEEGEPLEGEIPDEDEPEEDGPEDPDQPPLRRRR